MDLERAPKAEKSDLEVFLRVKGPELLQKHAANILMVVLLAAAAGFYLYTRSQNKAAEQAATNQNTAVAYDLAHQTRDLFAVPVFTDELARERQQKVRDVFSAVDAVLTSDAPAPEKAAAQLSKAEVLWQLANAPQASLATTQPTSGFALKTPTAYLDDAEEAYTDILSKYADEKEYAANALLSLAAIAETRGKFDDAKKWYDKVNADSTLRPVYHDIATARTKMLTDLRKPYTLAKPASQPTMPANLPLMLTPPDSTPYSTTMPAMAAPAAGPMSSPTTMPTTAPAAQ